MALSMDLRVRVLTAIPADDIAAVVIEDRR